MGDDDIDEADGLAKLLELLTERIEQLELAVTGRHLSTIPQRKLVTVGENVFASESSHKRARKKKQSPEVKLLKKTIRSHAQERLGIDVKSSIETWDVANHQDALEYNRGRSKAKGPTSENFVMDWDCTGLTPWTRDCTTIFGHEFLMQHQAHGFASIKGMIIDISLVKSSFRDYILYLKRRYNAEHKEPMEASDQRNKANKQARSWSRRQQLLGRRVALLKHHKFPEDCIDVVQEDLGVDGMSSEESDGEVGTVRTFKIKRVPWRSQDLTVWLHRVDALPTKNARNAVLTRRWPPRKRIISDLDSSRSQTVHKLPVNFYRGDWLTDQDERSRARLDVDEIPFELPKIDDFAH
ncbi:hypothetical protein CPB86DRAFT_845663 [Serendipita vermifera]|nr:hypothetical protein CPB86DRAFT_845663 [Serendipita vermifera]